MTAVLTVGAGASCRAGCLTGLVMVSLLLSGAIRAEIIKDAEQWLSLFLCRSVVRQPCR